MKKLIDLAFEYWEFETNPKRSQKARDARYIALFEEYIKYDKNDARIIIDIVLYAFNKNKTVDDVIKALEVLGVIT